MGISATYNLEIHHRLQNYLDNPGSWPLSFMNYAGDFSLSAQYERHPNLGGSQT